MRIDDIKGYIQECTECFVYYVEMHQSLRQVSKEMLLSKSTVKNRLEALKDINMEMYDMYLAERRRRKNGC